MIQPLTINSRVVPVRELNTRIILQLRCVNYIARLIGGRGPGVDEKKIERERRRR